VRWSWYWCRSVWVLVNTKTRRLARFPAHMIEAYSSKSPSYSKWGLDEGATCEKIPTVEPVEVSLAGLRAHWSDIDMNNHINNVTYLEWVMDVIPQHLWKVRYELCGRTRRITAIAMESLIKQTLSRVPTYRSRSSERWTSNGVPRATWTSPWTRK
jgi:hypothetical protein